MTDRTRIAWFTQSDPASMSGNFSRLVLPHLKAHCDIEVFTDSFEVFEGAQTFHYLSAFQRHQQSHFDVHCYQVENGKSAHFIRGALGLHPGVTLFHDFLMTDFGPDPLTNSPWSAVVEKFHDTSIDWPKRFTEFPRKEVFAEREAGLTVLPLFSSVRAHGEYKRAIKKTLQKDLSMYLPLPVENTEMPPCAHAPSIIHVGFCGSPRIEHRAHKVFHALHLARVPYKLFWLIDEGEQARAKELLEEFKIGSVELRTGRTPQHWESLLADIHIGVHTLFSVFGSTEYYFPQTLMAGRAALITRFADSENVPPNAAFQVDPGETEAAQMALIFQELHRNPALLHNDAGRTFALENHQASLVADELRRALKNAAPILTKFEERWSSLAQCAQSDLLEERHLGVDAWGKESLKRAFNELGWR